MVVVALHWRGCITRCMFYEQKVSVAWGGAVLSIGSTISG